jgi:CHAD domain-containing protein
MFNQFIHAYEIYVRQFEHELELIAHGASIESIHQMRVSVKKLRALSFFFESALEVEFKKKYSLKYHRKLFKSAAPIRNIDVFSNLLSNYKSEEINPHFLIHDLRVKRSDSIKSLNKHTYIYKNKAYKCSKEFIKVLKGIKAKKFESKLFSYLHDKICTVYFVSQKALNEDKLHKARIQLKAILVLLSISSDNLFHKTIFELKQFTETLGIRHDKEELKKYLIKYSKKTNSKFEKSVCNSILEKIKNENEEQKSELQNNLIRFSEQVKKSIHKHIQN